MTKKLKAIIVTCCIGIIAVAAYFVLDLVISNQTPSSPTIITITSMPASDVASVKVTLANGDYYYVTEDASVSATASSVTYKTTFNGIYEGMLYDSSRAKSLVSNSVILTATRDLGEADESEYSAYGLDEPLSTVVLTKTDGKEIVYCIGSRTTSGLYYLRKVGDSHIYTITSNTGTVFTRTPNDMRITTLPLETSLENVTTLTVKSGEEEPITITVADETSVYNPFSKYYTTSPWKQPKPANPDAITSLVEAMKSITIEEFVTPLREGETLDLAKYGLDKPWGYVKQELKNGTVYEYSFGAYKEDIVDYYCYAYDHSNNQVYVIVHDKATFVSKYSAVQLTTPYILNAMMSEMRFIEIEFGDEKHVLDCIREYLSEEEIQKLKDEGKDPSPYTSTYRMDGIKYKESALSSLYICITGARVQSVNKGYTHEDSPLLKVKFIPFDIDEPTREVAFYKVNDNFCAVYVDGVSDFLTSYSSVKSVLDGVKIVQNGEIPPYVI